MHHYEYTRKFDGCFQHKLEAQSRIGASMLNLHSSEKDQFTVNKSKTRNMVKKLCLVFAVLLFHVRYSADKLDFIKYLYFDRLFANSADYDGKKNRCNQFDRIVRLERMQRFAGIYGGGHKSWRIKIIVQWRWCIS